MTSAGEEDANTVLSDVEDDDPVPVPIVIKNSSQEDVSVERFRELLAEVDRERQAREAAENSKSELQVAFNRLKALAHEAIKKRDESTRQRDEALREKEEALRSNDKVSGELVEVIRLRDEVLKQKDEVLKQKDEALKQRDEIAKQLDEAVKAREVSRSEIETSAQMLVSGIEKISGKVRTFKNFTAGGLPRSQKYTGLPAIAYGVIKRSNEIVEELVRQMDATTKSRNEAREQMDHRNYEIAIEVSQLEATISGLREEVSKKNSVVENLEKSIAEKDAKISDMERDISEKIQLVESERAELKEIVSEYDLKLGNLESIMESQRPLLIDQLNLVSKIHDRIYDVIRIIDDNKLDQSEVSESLFLPQATDMEENVRASLAGMESIYELTRMVGEKIRNLIEDHGREAKSLNETVTRLVKEKEQIGSFLRNALSRRMALDPSSKMKELFQVAENGLREAGIEFKFSNLLEDGKLIASHDKAGVLETEEDELYNMVSTYPI